MENEKTLFKDMIDTKKKLISKMEHKMKQLKAVLYAKFGNQINLDDK